MRSPSNATIWASMAGSSTLMIAADDRRHERDSWLGKCCGSPERGASLRRQRGEPAAGELMHTRGYRQGLARIERSPVTLERAGKLEREEGVAARAFVDPPERRSRESGVEAVAEESAQRPEAERTYSDAVHSLLGKSCLELERDLLLPAPACSQQCDRLVIEAPQRELQHRRGTAVEPLQVVDSNEQGRRPCKRAQSAENADPNSPLIGRPALGLAQEKRDPQRLSLRVGQGVLDLPKLLLEKVAERDEGETRLSLYRACRDNAEPRLGSRHDPRAQESRLADPGLAFQQ